MTLPTTQTLYFEDLSIGMCETYTKVVKSSDVVGFAEISGDRNPIHLSEHFRRKRRSAAASRTGSIRRASSRR
ncbi:MAG: hypothetical protein R3C16_09085 [Hyphomonadaceae bacterium]